MSINHIKMSAALHITFLTGYALLLMTEGMLLPFLYVKGVPALLVKLMLFTKYGIVTLLFAIFVFRSALNEFKKMHKYELLGIFLACYNAFYVLISNTIVGHTDISRITQFIFPIFSYFAGRSLRITYPDFIKCSKIVVILFLLNTIYGVVDVLFIDASLWSDILQQERYLVDIKGYTLALYRGVIGNFYFDPYVLPVRRLIGTLGDPLAYAYSAVLPVCLMLYLPVSSKADKIKKYVGIVIGFIGISMSLTRAIILSFMTVMMLKKIFKRYLLFSVITIAIVLLLFLSSAGFIVQSIIGLKDSSTKGHLFSLAGIYNLNFFEFFFGSIMSDNSIAFESGFLNYIVALGAVLAMLFYSFIYKMLSTLLKCPLSLGTAVGVCGTIGIFTSVIFSESYFSFTGYGLFWLFAGIITGILYDKRYDASAI